MTAQICAQFFGGFRYSPPQAVVAGLKGGDYTIFSEKLIFFLYLS